jgi:hypothetical protein
VDPVIGQASQWIAILRRGGLGDSLDRCQPRDRRDALAPTVEQHDRNHSGDNQGNDGRRQADRSGFGHAGRRIISGKNRRKRRELGQESCGQHPKQAAVTADISPIPKHQPPIRRMGTA